MEDEDGESKIMDMWSILEDQQLKDPTFGNTLKHSVDNVYIDTIEEERRISRYNIVTPKDSPSRNTSSGSKSVFKGFKKRILAQAQETQSVASKSSQEQVSHPNVSSKITKEKRTENKRGKITEYAQYLGLQPSSKIKCSKCYSSTNLNLKQSQCVCNIAMAPMQGLPSTSETSSQSHPPNFKIARKVYLCSACETYFENWNLFLHMRDIHKRHICLFCLGMFGQAERLSYHLYKTHSIPHMGFNTVEDFYSAFKGSCYLICCTCEKMFSETDNFSSHYCSPLNKQEDTTNVCNLFQTSSNTKTCALAVEPNKDANPMVPVTMTTQTETVSAIPIEKPSNMNNKGTSKKVIKNNRNKYGEKSISNSCQQNAKKVNAKVGITQSSENQLSSDSTVIRDRNVQDETAVNIARDTVLETIMEVSKCIDESCTSEIEQKDHSHSVTKTSSEKSQTPNNNQIEPYDSITQTIMEVSRCTNDTEDDEDIPNENANQSDAADINNKTESETENSIPLEPTINEESHETNSEHQMKKETDTMEQNETLEMSKTKSDSESHSSSSPVHSPISRSLFSPQHESQQDLQPKEEYPDDGSKHVEAAPPTESQTSVSFNTAPVSDRSLVIKICTNKNSQFSVSSTASIETHNISRDSEENNNAEEDSSSDEKLLGFTQKDKVSIGCNQINEADSDSDSYKLAVVDSNAEDDIKELYQSEDRVKAKGSTEIQENTNAYEEKEGFTIGDNAKVELSTTTEQYNNDATKNIVNSELVSQSNDGIILAGEDVPPIDLNVEGTLDSTKLEDLLKKCIEAASPLCVYCNHARHIAVNGKQLGLHMLAEHKFHPQHPAIIIQPEQFTVRVKKSLDEQETNFFNLDTYSSTNGTYNIQTFRTYECFHCRYNSTIHKELYSHHRKMHQKTILICIMCKSTFYSYSELLCHLCPGIYLPNMSVKYRCCLCSISSLPSAFRLMVHLRKSHHACDVCLETTGNQQRLSNHVWKHKLHHLCYRCGIAYRNKPDITKHLFWKHGTESVLCKKCLQKKWPHIYHFCIPPTAFVCEECGSSFSRAVALKVHKRLHSGDQPYSCSKCTSRFISQRLLAKHEESHKEPLLIDVCTVDAANNQILVDNDKSDKEKTTNVDIMSTTSNDTKDVKETMKKVVDVYDLPPLNLSSESESEMEETKDDSKKNEESAEKNEIIEQKTEETVSLATSAKVESPVQTNDNIVDEEENEEEKKQEAKIMDGIWDNFKTYAASLEMQESANLSNKETGPEIDVAYLRSIVLADHDYCIVWSEKDKNTEDGMKEDEKGTNNADISDYSDKLQRSPSAGSLAQQNTGCESDVNKKKGKSPKKKKQNGSTSSSDSSSESDSSSCSCGTNCSCSSSSSGSSSSSSSSSDSDSSASESSPRKSSKNKERKKEKEVVQEEQGIPAETENKEAVVDVTDAPIEPTSAPKLLLRESDLETDETITDEDFYDEYPQQLANKIMAEKRNQLLLLAEVAPASTDSVLPLNNGITDESYVTPSPNPASSVEDQQLQQRKKVKTKKRKRGEKVKQRVVPPMVESLKLNIPKVYYQKNSNFSVMSHHQLGRSTPNLITNNIQTTVAAVESNSHVNQNIGGSGSETENKRSSKRKRIPKRFYGDSSDEETEKQPTMKWRKVVEPPAFVAAAQPKPLPQRLSFGGKTVAYRANVAEPEPIVNVTATSATESEEPADTSSESSGSDVDTSVHQQPQGNSVSESTASVPERSVNLYCYCQCPYDEVSEMIACDGRDCRIEWFHFECVGIMIPPKGKWYCPDCRKKHGIMQNSEDYFD
ncbi:PREDICTED: uncharacterized protein LOC106794061 [Polistes canadensis]|uniref:uncharacterized protein LOC106794061 n=1 Tax=Polistes canadensis TaxID=91411 RepID=UPI000718C3FF|nr:PREDICTED: uncharacterized protein LOC106794061 [Polistes canadensis]XP_014616956.1 PREDICTED: uncharacterized protein LOC106794061 [Polistes canadensis]